MWYVALLSAEISVRRQVDKKAFTKIINCKCNVRFLLRCRPQSPESDPHLTDVHTLTAFPCLSSKCPYWRLVWREHAFDVQQCENQLKYSLILILRAGRAADGGVDAVMGQLNSRISPQASGLPISQPLNGLSINYRLFADVAGGQRRTDKSNGSGARGSKGSGSSAGLTATANHI